ncbi:protein ILRUN-like [Pollicipes pollicipes]|uniref:protein ILRUN-like n=1 Tax=Pollicipes pollicipes TaxID=41117 RepID=UPI00188576EF|nr:protein ILRUN-like [Pollicipes pollicipes]XP_037071008.1 protein ILRUN-like [Pollicipes pollicipes]
MEVDDADVDSTLLQQFSCMGTTDRDVLISQFYKLVGDGANDRDAAFYLDMNNWNLQEAVGAYFDLQSGPVALLPPPSLVLLEDATVGGGESVPPDTAFVKTWRIKNGGRERWPRGCVLRLVYGIQLSEQTSVPLSCLEPDQVTDVSIPMRSPTEPGIYQSKWRATTVTGADFGDVIWVILTVQPDGVTAVTQQMTRLAELGTLPGSGPPANPFAEPSSPPDGRPAPHLAPFPGVNAPGRPAAPADDSWALPNADADMD